MFDLNMKLGVWQEEHSLEAGEPDVVFYSASGNGQELTQVPRLLTTWYMPEEQLDIQTVLTVPDKSGRDVEQEDKHYPVAAW